MRTGRRSSPGKGIRGRAVRFGARDERPRGDAGFGLIEGLVAITVATIGLIALAGLQVATASQSRIAQWRTQQALAAQEVLERALESGYASVTTASDSATIDGHTFRVNLSVSSPAIRVKQVVAAVAPVGAVGPDTFITRIYQTRAVPPPP